MPDELAVIRQIVGAQGALPKGYSAIGDDVATIPVRKGKLVLKVDLLNRKTDVPKGMTFRQAARKSIAMCVSDFASKGVRPDSFMVSIGLPRGTTSAQVTELGLGFKDAVNEWGARLVGGDTSEADDLVLNCAMVGFADKMVQRAGARPGDLVVVTGSFGLPPAGLRILLHGATASKSFEARAVRSVLEPTPNLEVGLAIAGFLSASMDSSDGLSITLHTLAEASGVGMDLDVLPAAPGVGGFAKENGLDSDRLVLGGGEEYLIVGTVARRRFKKAREAARSAGGDLIPIGKTSAKSGIIILTRGGKKIRVRREGWTHLS